MTRSALIVLISLAALSGAHAQVPGAIGQQPGTLAPAPPVYVPPSPVAPAPVPSVVTPLPSPRYGVPAGVTAPVYGGGATPTVRYRKPVKPRKKLRRPRVSEVAPYPSICRGC